MQKSENMTSVIEISYMDALKLLSPREVEILDLLLDGNSNQDIADELYLSKYTIESHKKNICKKLSIKGVKSLIKWGINAKYRNI